jgi:FAD/FMN-containing dehydrogenase
MLAFGTGAINGFATREENGMSPARVSELAPAFAGRFLQPTDPDYDEARRVHNGLIDKRPALIAQCRGIADVADAVRIGRTLGLDIAVRGGGHNPGGRATIDGGLVIDLSLMRAVLVDPVSRTAMVQGGARWADVNRETQAYGRAVTGGAVSTTGVGGLTLGGGLGWLMARCGMAMDNVRAVDLVLADGSLVRASATEHPDLFWAVRGGGGNFGVAAAFEFQLHPIGPMVTGGIVAWPIARAREVLRLYRELTAAASDDLMTFAALLTAPDGETKLVGLALGHFGAAGEAEAALAPVKAFGTPVLDTVGPISYAALNGMLDGAFPKGARNYWKSHFLAALSDEAIEALVDQFVACPTPMGQVMLEHFHGAATRVPVDATAYALRSEGHNAVILGEWLDPGDDEACIAWARDTYARLQPFVSAQRYLNYLDRDDGEAVSAAYGPNLPRLREVKARYDPDNVFRNTVNIEPASGAGAGRGA